MSFPIRPGKTACAGLVAIFMVLPNSIWKGPDAKVSPVSTRKIESVRKMGVSHTMRVKLREVAR